jgi:hypothetical protein
MLKFDNTYNLYQTVLLSPIPVYTGLVNIALVFPKVLQAQEEGKHRNSAK